MGRYEPAYQKRIIESLAEEFDVPKEKVRKAVMHQFRFVRKVMTKGLFESVRLRYFGKFKVNPRRLEKLQENND